jgi:hypothetical protein
MRKGAGSLRVPPVLKSPLIPPLEDKGLNDINAAILIKVSGDIPYFDAAGP